MSNYNRFLSLTVSSLCLGALLVTPLVLAQTTVPSSANSDAMMKMAPLVVTGTRTPHRLNESPVRTELLTSADIQLAGARSFADTLELVPGVRIESNCQNCGTSDILMLGLEGKYTSVLFDGLPLFSGLAAVYGLDQIPALFLDRIEVVKGGGSAVYGSGAVGGVVNILSRDPARSGGLSEFRYDSIRGQPALQVSGLADYVSADVRRKLTVYAQSAKVDPVDLNHDGYSDLTKRDLQVFGVRFSQQTKPGVLRADYNRTVEFRRGGNKFDLPDNLADISERINTSRDSGSLLWSAAVSPDFDYQVSGSFAYIDRQTFYGGLFGHSTDEPLVPESANGAGDNDQPFIDRGYSTYGQVAQDEFGFTKNWVCNFDTQFNYLWSHHHTSLGVQYYREKIDDIVPVSTFVTDYPILPDIATGNNLGVFIQDDWHPAKDWELVMGLRGDKNSELDHVVVSPRINLKWAPSDELTLRTTWGTGFRAPQAFDEDLHIELVAGNRATTRQAADLREEQSYSTLLSATWNPAFARGRMSIEAAGFYTHLDGTFTNSEIQTDPVSGEDYRTRYNGPAAEVGGMEFSVGMQPMQNLRMDIGYVAQFARYKEGIVLFDDGAGHVVRERDFIETPHHYAVAQGTYSRKKLGSLSLNATYTGAMKDINLRTGVLNEETKSFLVWNVTASRSFQWASWPDVTLTIGVKNIFDSRQEDLEVGVDRDPYYLYGPRTPRTLFTSARLEF